MREPSDSGNAEALEFAVQSAFAYPKYISNLAPVPAVYLQQLGNMGLLNISNTDASDLPARARISTRCKNTGELPTMRRQMSALGQSSV